MLLKTALATLNAPAMAQQRLRALSALVAELPLMAVYTQQQQQRAFSRQQPRTEKKQNQQQKTVPPKQRTAIAPRRRTNGKMDLYFQRNSEQKEHRERFQQQSARAQRWMEFRAAAGDFSAILKSVADCYEPLFRTHPALAGLTCPLNELVAKTTAVDTEEYDHEDDDEEIESARGERHAGPRQVLPRYQEGRTKMMEQLALEFLFKGGENELAVTVYENRRFVSEAIAKSGLAQNDRERRMPHEHYRSFFSMATGAYAALNKHEQVVHVYEELMNSKKLWPTVAMNVNYVRALAVLRRYEDVERAYRQISATDGFQNVFFYRCMLFYVGASGNTSVLQDVRVKMHELRFELRPMDFLHCMRAYDEFYYHTGTSIAGDNDQQQVPAMPTSYVGYLALMNDNEDSQDKATAARAQEGARNALAIFDELLQRNVDTNKNKLALIPGDLSKPLYPRVLTAAIKLGDYDKVASIVAIRRQRGNPPFCEDALPLAVTGLLLGDRPEDAWRLVQEEYEHASPRPRVHTAIVGNLLGYLTLKQQHNFLILKILDDLKRRAAAFSGTVPNLHVRAVIDTLCADRETLDDEQLYEIVAKHNAVFKVTNQPFWFANFLTSCLEHRRFEAAKSAFQARSEQEIPTIPVALAISLMQNYADMGDFEFVYRLFTAVKLCTKADRCEVCFLAIRACAQVEWLGEDAMCEIYETHLKHLGQDLEIPDDIKTMLKL